MPLSASPLTLAATSGLRRLADQDPDPVHLNAALRHLAKWRSELVANTISARTGDKICAGPFKGMNYRVRASEGSRAARLLGVYEASLAPVIEAAVARGYPLVVDVGSAEGYYAVGMALRLPAAQVLARDDNPQAQALCRELARLNGVEARVEVGGRMEHRDFDICAAQRTLVICDIEGAEDALLDPIQAPGLLKADILVECHEGMAPGLTDRLAARFSASHHITRIGRLLDTQALPDWMEEWSDMDRLIALWEWRASPTPWLWMQAHD
jgi:hypothetical protein